MLCRQFSIRFILSVVVVSALSGCSYKLLQPGNVRVGELEVTLTSEWNELATSKETAIHTHTRVWTQHGIWLDRLILVANIPPGEPIFDTEAGDFQNIVLPLFEADMTEEEIRELVETSLIESLQGTAVIGSSNLRPKMYGNYHRPGFVFDLDAQLPETPLYKGFVGALVKADELFLLIYLAATPYYYEKYLPEALQILDSARVVPQDGA